MVKRKKWTRIEAETPSLVKLREKRKWQIALRRYVIEENLCRSYAPYFGLDIKKMREWLENQFTDDMGWNNFGQKWQFDHVIPVTYFDFGEETDLKLCWNFLNLRVGMMEETGKRFSISAALHYFGDIYRATNLTLCIRMIEKLQGLENNKNTDSQKQQDFIKTNSSYLEIIDDFTAFEFELLNLGRDPVEVKKEAAFIKKYQNS